MCSGSADGTISFLHDTPSDNTIMNDCACVRAALYAVRLRELDLLQHVSCINTFNLSLSGTYFAQAFPMDDVATRRPNMAISWFMWTGCILWVPLSTLQLSPI